MEKAFGKVLSLLCLALCLTFAVSACGGADPLVGTWTDNNEDGLTITFTQDHTFAISSESGTMLTGTYALDLSTPGGLLSFDANANKQSDLTLSITNSGNVDLQNINLTSSAPEGWTVEFSQSSIDVLEAGATQEVTAYVTPSEEAMSGDYVMTISAQSSNASDTAEFRVSVKTETIWGVVGILLILAAAGCLWYVFRKYGRR